MQLIKTASDSHLWAETFDRHLTDIFSVESEVARTIADQLRAKLSGQEEQVIAQKPTQNPAAYDAYLRGLSIERAQSGFEAAKGAGAAYAEAVQIDPSFALAWARLAIIRSRLYLYGVDATTNTTAATREAADKAMSLQPELAEAWMAQAAYRYRVNRDFRGALQAYEEASKRFPNSSQILIEWAVVETRLGSLGQGGSALAQGNGTGSAKPRFAQHGGDRIPQSSATIPRSSCFAGSSCRDLARRSMDSCGQGRSLFDRGTAQRSGEGARPYPGGLARSMQ